MEWCDAKFNINHAIDNGRINQFGENSVNAKLTKQQVSRGAIVLLILGVLGGVIWFMSR